MHYVMFGGSVFALFAGDLLLVPEVHRHAARRATRARSTSADVRRLQPHLLRAASCSASQGMPRRVASYLPTRRLHDAQPHLHHRRVPARRVDRSPFLWNVVALVAARRAAPATTRGDRARRSSGRRRRRRRRTTSTPLPPIRSNRPVWDLHHPSTRRRSLGHAWLNGPEVADRPCRGARSSASACSSRCSAVVYWFACYEDAGHGDARAGAGWAVVAERGLSGASAGTPRRAPRTLPDATPGRRRGHVDRVPHAVDLAVRGSASSARRPRPTASRSALWLRDHRHPARSSRDRRLDRASTMQPETALADG